MAIRDKGVGHRRNRKIKVDEILIFVSGQMYEILKCYFFSAMDLGLGVHYFVCVCVCCVLCCVLHVMVTYCLDMLCFHLLLRP